MSSWWEWPLFSLSGQCFRLDIAVTVAKSDVIFHRNAQASWRKPRRPGKPFLLMACLPAASSCSAHLPQQECLLVLGWSTQQLAGLALVRRLYITHEECMELLGLHKLAQGSACCSPAVRSGQGCTSLREMPPSLSREDSDQRDCCPKAGYVGCGPSAPHCPGAPRSWVSGLSGGSGLSVRSLSLRLGPQPQ